MKDKTIVLISPRVLGAEGQIRKAPPPFGIASLAATLIKKGYDVHKTRDLLGIDDDNLSDVDIKIIEQVQNDSRIKYRNIPRFNINNYTSTKTDADVAKFLKKLFKS